MNRRPLASLLVLTPATRGVHRSAMVCLALAAGCQSSEKSNASSQRVAASAARADAAYKTDIARLCDSLALSGADKMEKGERLLPHATWLHANLETQESRDFLVRIQPLTGEPKAAALEAEARRVGLTSGCALAAEWRVPP